jgi:hypothetical protein
MAAAAQEVNLAPTRLSFRAAIELVCVAIEDCHLVSPAHHPALAQRLLHDLAACRLPPRAQRTNPRVVKRKMSKFKLKRGAPPPASQQLVAFAATILLCVPDDPLPSDYDAPLAADASLTEPCSVSCRI